MTTPDSYDERRAWVQVIWIVAGICLLLAATTAGTAPLAAGVLAATCGVLSIVGSVLLASIPPRR